jgi:hypothetical protein
LKTDSQRLTDRLHTLLAQWRTAGLPSREALLAAADELIEWKASRGLRGLWALDPLLLTATLDDGWGFGLQVIERWAQVSGLKTHFLGLLRPPEAIIEACRHYQPEFIGLTVLQFDSEAALAQIRRVLPDRIKIIAGGAALKYDPGMAARTGIDCAAEDVSVFLEYLLKSDTSPG